MFALATAAHGQDSTQLLIILAAVGAAIFWRALIKIGLAFVIIGFFVLLITGAMELLRGFHL